MWCALALLAAVFMGLSTPQATAAEKSFSLESLTTAAVISPDGSLTVTETIVYDFRGGPFNFGIRSFLAEDRSRISAFSVTDIEGFTRPVIAPGTSDSGEWEWRLGGVSDTVETYTIRYVVARAITLGTDVGELYWQFLGKDHPGVGRVDITIDVPGSFPVATATTPPTDSSVTRAWGHGPRQGTLAVEPSRVMLSVTGVPAGRFVEARVAVPASAFSGDAVSGPRLPTILKEEGTFVDQTLAEDSSRDGSPSNATEDVGNVIGPGAGILGLAGLGALWARFGREPKVDPMIGEYWREPLDDPPAVVLANLAKGTVPLGPAIGSTLIDLAQRGFLTITEERHERLGPDEVIHRLRWKGKPTAGIAPFERELLEHVFLGKDEVTTDDVTAWATANRAEAKAFAADFRKKITEAYNAESYRVGKRGGPMGWLLGLVGAIALTGFISARLGGHLALVAYITAGVVLIVGLNAINNRTQHGADEAAKAESLKRFLKDFSNLKEAPAGHLILWERFLVYAVTLGVSKELLQGLQTRLPAVANDPNYGIWYAAAAGPGRRFDGIDAFPGTFGAKAATALVPPSKSGSGGGFSGGGGGGGGGGGFGAR